MALVRTRVMGGTRPVLVPPIVYNRTYYYYYYCHYRNQLLTATRSRAWT